MIKTIDFSKYTSIFTTINHTQKKPKTPKTMETTELNKTIIASDYYINYYGKVIDIKNTDKILCLFKTGSGFGDGNADRVWSSSFELYIPNSKDFGKTLVKIGDANENGNGYSVSSSFTINGESHYFEGLSISSFFNTIFKR